jgi:hypothetical protein
LGSICVASETVYRSMTFTNILAIHGLSLIGTNLLCHRYLCKKARVMISPCAPDPLLLPPARPPLCACPHPSFPTLCHHAASLNDANDPSIKWLENLEAPFVWEARSLCMIAVAAPLFMIYSPAGYTVGGLGVLVIIAMASARFLFAFSSLVLCFRT